MEWVETTGRTVEEAKEAALDQLGVDEQDAEFEIVEEPRFGLFGRLRSEARVRARVRPTKPRAKEERRDRRGRRRPAGSDGAGATTDDETPPAAPAAPRAGGRRPVEAAGNSASGRAAAGNSAPTATESRESHESRDDTTDDRPPRRERSGSSGGRSPRAPRERRPDSSANQNDEITSPGGGMEVALDEQGAVAKEFLDGLVERMDLEAEVTIAQPEEDTIELNLEGPDLGLLIGPKGSTLLAIQDLTRTVVQRKTSAANGRIHVDVSGYRRKRKDALARFSRQVAEEVQTTGTRRVLEPMTAADRKIVHDTVNDIDGVMTTSEGEEPRRRVVILPTGIDASHDAED
ncbi:MAG: spoIIIJ-associated protein [Acidimicrobiaceae bacterium]|nr:spoIIIJ-associated protein [Acidimicrobiaceae bacterium]